LSASSVEIVDQGSEPPGAPLGAVRARSPRQLFWERLRRDRAALAGAGVIVLLAAVALGAPMIADAVGRGPNDLSLAREMTDDFGLPRGPNSTFWFGADKAGREIGRAHV
jgi:peptide/nickel transport system permease protein